MSSVKNVILENYTVYNKYSIVMNDHNIHNSWDDFHTWQHSQT